ncbi:MAG: branched-chain amino acid transaminase [Acidobacteria bacterium]|uniref:Branched-chain-amino-acid aminotransferase n=1 Tax=Candidatus Polarisedimenticola svalbardensis TaxID=2886004 RepID=A0A8J6XTN9_9BACT|nr:branched-chain amino acid transaminase [Candidatus Polarisedimenticola svalbardensis]
MEDSVALQPSKSIWFNGKLIPWDEARVHVLSHVIHYGSSVFEGIRCYEQPVGSAAFRLEDHIRRLFDSARIYRMEIPWSRDEVVEACVETVRANGLSSCYIRPVVYRGFGSMGVNPLPCPVELVIAAWEWGAYLGDEALDNGVDVQVSTWARMAPNTIPAMAKAGANYANAQLVKMEALSNGFAEGVVLDVDGFVCEGSGENIFLVREGKVFTPPLGASILSGITRASVIALLRDMGLEVAQTKVPREALYLADELFFTGTAAEITPIRSVDRLTVGPGKPGPITKKIQKAYLSVLKGESGDTRGWLHPVTA